MPWGAVCNALSCNNDKIVISNKKRMTSTKSTEERDLIEVGLNQFGYDDDKECSKDKRIFKQDGLLSSGAV